MTPGAPIRVPMNDLRRGIIRDTESRSIVADLQAAIRRSLAELTGNCGHAATQRGMA